MLGDFRDDPETFERAADYLRNWPMSRVPECIGYGRHDLGKSWVQCGWCAGHGVVRREDLSR
jgi:hypothetical protein